MIMSTLRREPRCSPPPPHKKREKKQKQICSGTQIPGHKGTGDLSILCLASQLDLLGSEADLPGDDSFTCRRQALGPSLRGGHDYDGARHYREND